MWQNRITIRFDSKFQIIAELFDLIKNEKKHYSHSTIAACQPIRTTA